MKPRIEDEIVQIRQEINRLNHRVSLLERQLNLQANLQASKVHKYTDNPFDNIENVAQPEVKQAFTKNNIENNIGKNLMSIIASLMVFIGICGFIALVIQNSSEIAKVIVMYIFSFAFYIAGRLILNKKRDALSLSLTSCGIGAVYISLLITHFYFKMIGEIVLGILLIGWSISAFLLAKKIKSDLFFTISYIGYSLAISLGTWSILSTDIELSANLVAMVLATCFTIFTYIIIKDDDICNLRLRYIIFVISIPVCWLISQLVSNAHEQYRLMSNTVDLITTISILKLFTYQVKGFIENTKHEFETILVSLIALVIQTITIVVGMQDTVVEWSIPLIILYIYSEFKSSGIEEKQVGKISYAVFISLSCVLASQYFFIFLLVMPFISFILGCKNADKNLELMAGNVYMVWATYFIIREYDAWIGFSIPVILMWICSLWTLTKKYLLSNKIILYFNVILGSWIFICMNTTGDMNLILPYIIICMILIFTGLSAFATDWSNGKSFIHKEAFSKYDVLFGINHVLQYIWLGWGTLVIEFTEPGGLLQFIIVLISLMLCISDLHYVMEIKNDWKALAAEIKSTLFTCYSLSLYLPPDTGYILSIFCIILAITSIYFGFKFEIKGFRLYGLGLSMLSVFKLLLVDIYIDEPIVRILSFIGAGILCFVIVFIYNKLSKDDNSEKDTI